MEKDNTKLLIIVTMMDILLMVHNENNDFHIDSEQFSQIVQNILDSPQKTEDFVDYIKTLEGEV